MRKLYFHDHQRVWIGRDVVDLIRLTNDAADSLRALHFRVMRVDELRLEERLVAIVDSEDDLGELGTLRQTEFVVPVDDKTSIRIVVFQRTCCVHLAFLAQTSSEYPAALVVDPSAGGGGGGRGYFKPLRLGYR